MSSEEEGSLPTSEEFEVVGCAGCDPQLHIEGSEEQLRESLREVLQDLGRSPNQSQTEETSELDAVVEKTTAMKSVSYEGPPVLATANSFERNFCMYATSPSPMDEDLMSISISIADGDYTAFDRITYLGCVVVNNPRDDLDIRKNMRILNEQSSPNSMTVSLSLPVNSEGSVVLYEPSSSNEIACFHISQIKALVAGDISSKDANCLTLVHRCSQDDVPESTVFQCHVFRCEIPEAVSKIMQCFTVASKKVPKLSLPKSVSFGMGDKGSSEFQSKNIITYVFEGTLEIKEDDLKGGYAYCAKDKDYFKLRCKLKKSVVLTVQQVSEHKELEIDRCFGLLISPGRNVREHDMQLIDDMTFTKPSGEKSPYVITGLWDPNDPVFEILNTETPKDRRVYMTVACDFVMSGIEEHIRFVIETKAKIFPPTERFWYFSRRTLYEQFYLRVNEVDANCHGDYALEVVAVTSASKLQNKKSSMTLDLNKATPRSSNLPTPASPEEAESSSDNDEPLLSGTGEVSKDCTKSQMAGWSDVLPKWRHDFASRPRHLSSLVRRGIPEALRGEVWLRLAGCTDPDQKQVVDAYKTLLTKESSFENVIQRDIYRTFPAHEMFSEKNGFGQESLLKICKAYSLYDPEIGYCQGLSFLVAALILHMPEEEAYGVLMKIMFDYQIRNMFRNGFEELHLKFYQLQRLMQEYVPSLAAHFEDLGVECHMFASQWFLTLFTAKFPLVTVFFIIDLFLLDGMNVIFQVAIALLMLSQKDLLALDFEGVLKHFRVSLPKKYRTEEACRILIRKAVKVKVKKLKRYEKDYALFKEQEKSDADPIKALQKENQRLLESNIHLDRENDDLTNELINIKLQLRSDLVKSEEKAESLSKELQTSMFCISELEEEKKRLSFEVTQLKEMCRRELQRAEAENVNKTAIISEYDQLCKQLKSKLEKEQTSSNQNIDLIKAKIKSCDVCTEYIEEIVPTTAYNKSQKEVCLQNKTADYIEMENQARELELELARTKLALVESECKNQDLTHQLNAAINELNSSTRNTWFQKTISHIREASSKKENPTSKDTG